MQSNREIRVIHVPPIESLGNRVIMVAVRLFRFDECLAKHSHELPQNRKISLSERPDDDRFNAVFQYRFRFHTPSELAPNSA